jgi:hypothetical protein
VTRYTRINDAGSSADKPYWRNGYSFIGVTEAKGWNTEGGKWIIEVENEKPVRKHFIDSIVEI